MELNKLKLVNRSVNIKWLFIILFVFISEYTLAQFESAFTLENPYRLRKIDYIYFKTINNKDSTTVVGAIDNLRSLAEKYNDEQSKLFGKMLLLLHDVKLDNTCLDISIRGLLDILNICKLKDYTLLTINITLYLGDLWKTFGRTGIAVSYYMQADNLSSKVNEELLPRLRRFSQYDLARALYDIGDYERARDFLESISLIHDEDHYGMLAKDLLSQIYLKLEKYQLSEKNINDALLIYLKEDTTSWYFRGWRGIFLGNIGKIRYYQKDYEQAIPLFIKAIKITESEHMDNNVATFGLLLADCYIQTGNKLKVKSLVPVIQPAIYKGNEAQHFIDMYKLLLILDDRTISLKRSTRLLDSLILWKSKLMERNDQNTLFRKDLVDQISYYQKNEELLRKNVRQGQILRTALWSLLSLLILIVGIILYKKQKEIRLQQKEAKSTQELNNQNLASAQKQLDTFMKTLQNKSLEIEKLELQLGYDTTNPHLAKLKANTILTESDWIKFKELFEQAIPNYFDRLKSHFPNLTSGEIRYIALIKLSFNNREMASTLGVGDGAIRTMKSRLMKKIELHENENLENWIQNL